MAKVRAHEERTAVNTVNPIADLITSTKKELFVSAKEIASEKYRC